MRISDWSSDVCSSDLHNRIIRVPATDQFAFFQLLSFLDKKMRTVGNIIVHHYFAQTLVNNPDFARAADNDLNITPIRRLATYCTYVFKFKLSVEFRNDLRFGSNI